MNSNIQNRFAHKEFVRTDPSSQRQPKRYSQEMPRSINEELLQLVAKVESLENQLIDEQRLKEMLLEENGTNKQYLQKLKNNQNLREVRIRQLRDEAQIHRLNIRNVEECEASMKALHKQIEDLKLCVISKEGECVQVNEEVMQIEDKKNEINSRKRILEKQRKMIESRIEEYFKPYPAQFDKAAPHIQNLEARATNLLIGLQSVKLQDERLKKQHTQALSREAEMLIKLEYEEKLLNQRVHDIEKSQELVRICQHQDHLDKMVEQMLLKEDELVDQLRRLNADYEVDEKKLRITIQQKQDDWALERQSYQRELRELRMTHKRLEYDIQQFTSQTASKQQKRYSMSIEYELMHKLHINLHSMQKLREVEEKNNYLKRKINQTRQVMELIHREKELLPTARFHY